MNLQDEIILSVVDNLAIGSIVALGAYLLTKSIEKYKASQAMRAEAAKLRIAKMGPIWENTYTVKTELDWVREKSNEIKKMEASKLTDNEKLTLFTNNSAAPLAIEKIEKDVLPKLNDAAVEINRLFSQIEANRFWFGINLLKIHKDQLEALEELASLIREDIYKHNSIKSIEGYFRIGKKLHPANLDITNVLKHV